MPQTEQEAMIILREEGFEDIEWESRMNWTSPYDFRAKRDGIEHIIEVKSSISHINETKLSNLKEYNKPILFLIVTEDAHKFLTLEEVSDFINREKVDNKEKIYDVLVEKGDWMVIAKIADAAELSRQTTSKFLWMLYYGGRAENRQFGPSQAFRVKEG